MVQAGPLSLHMAGHGYAPIANAVHNAAGSGYSRIALDSQGAISRIEQLYTQPARSWIELSIQTDGCRGATVMWVKGHAGVKGNEAADRRAKLRAYGGRVTQANKITPAGIRQDHPIHTKPKHLQWSRKQVKGLTFVVTDRGPMKRWLAIIGRSPQNTCQCGEIQNAVHLRRCHLIGDGKGRSVEECYTDRAWCEAVVDFLEN